jgi:3-oxoacyl-(acyl-carrier-protein) synthase
MIAADAGLRPERTVAVIGMACRFPGAPDLESFANLLRRAGVAIGEVPANRWSAACYRGAPGQRAASYATQGGFIDGIDTFDCDLFGLSADEAAALDPQQRLVIELAWTALLHAAIAPDDLRGRDVGVFVGGTNVDYHRWVYADPARLDARSAPGSSLGSGANRLSYLLDLRGPSVTVDTGCSSALVALHQARRALEHGECELALVAGVNAMLLPGNAISHCQSRGLSPSNRNLAFDRAADGYVRGEGCGAVVLARAGERYAQRRRPLAWLAGSAVNQAGQTNGFGAPGGPAQQRVLAAALRDAGLRFGDIGYVECHGSATPLGDAIEIQALRTAAAAAGPREAPCWIGSVKNNIGHLEAAAGMAGLVKVLLMLERDCVFPQGGVEEPNKALQGADALLRLPQSETAWPRGQAPRRAAVRAFSFGGTYCEVIVEGNDRPPRPQPALSPYPVMLAARTPQQLRQWAGDLAAWLRATGPVSLSEVGAALNAQQGVYPYRAALLADSTDDLAATLASLAKDPSAGWSAPEANLCLLLPEVPTAQAASVAALARHLPALAQCLAALRQQAADLAVPPDEEADAWLHTLALGRAVCAWLSGVHAWQAQGMGRLLALCLADLLTDEQALVVLRLPPDARAPATDRLIEQLAAEGSAAPRGLNLSVEAGSATLHIRRRSATEAAFTLALYGTTPQAQAVLLPAADQAAIWPGYAQALAVLAAAGALQRLQDALPALHESAVAPPPCPLLREVCPIPGGSYDAAEGNAPRGTAVSAPAIQAAEPVAITQSARPAVQRAAATPPQSNAAGRAGALKAHLLQWIAARLACDPMALGADRPMAELGMSSLDFVELAAHLSQQLGRPVEPVIFWSYPSIDALSVHLADLSDGHSSGVSPDSLERLPATGHLHAASGRAIQSVDDIDEAAAQAELLALLDIAENEGRR